MNELIKRIEAVYGTICDRDCAGLEDMDDYWPGTQDLMEHMFADTLHTLSISKLETLAERLEMIAADMEL